MGGDAVPLLTCHHSPSPGSRSCYKSQAVAISRDAQWSRSTTAALRCSCPVYFLTKAATSCTEQIAPAGSQRHRKGIEHKKTKCCFLLAFLSVSFQNMVAYVMLSIVMFVLVYRLIINEVAVTFPDTSCFIPR